MTSKLSTAFVSTVERTLTSTLEDGLTIENINALADLIERCRSGSVFETPNPLLLKV